MLQNITTKTVAFRSFKLQKVQLPKFTEIFEGLLNHQGVKNMYISNLFCDDKKFRVSFVSQKLCQQIVKRIDYMMFIGSTIHTGGNYNAGL